MRSGIFLVRLTQDKEVDHPIVVDGEKKVIEDSEEKSCIALTMENIMKCGEHNARKLRVQEIREIVATEGDKIYPI